MALEILRQAGDFVRAHPFAVLAASHAVTGAIYVWSVSDGKPGKWIVKKLFQAALSAVPASVVDAEQAKLRKNIQKSVIGHSLDGETLYNELPEKGEERCLWWWTETSHAHTQHIRGAASASSHSWQCLCVLWRLLELFIRIFTVAFCVFCLHSLAHITTHYHARVLSPSLPPLPTNQTYRHVQGGARGHPRKVQQA